MLAAERRKIIIEQLQSEKKVVTSQLSALFNVSDETIRRDLDRLCQDGLAIKSHGGAIINEEGSELPYKVRKMHKPNEKKIIAELVETLVQDNESIMLDASTTAVFITKMLKKKKGLTVITNSVEVIVESADMSDWTVIAPGGRVIGDYLAITGQQVIESLADYQVDKAIFSCKGLDIERGIFDGNDIFAQVKRRMLKSAKTKILAADLGKFGRPALSKIGDFGCVDMIITDARPNDRWLEVFEQHEVNCLFGI